MKTFIPVQLGSTCLRGGSSYNR